MLLLQATIVTIRIPLQEAAAVAPPPHLGSVHLAAGTQSCNNCVMSTGEKSLPSQIPSSSLSASLSLSAFFQ
jgi:hypothetical protein